MQQSGHILWPLSWTCISPFFDTYIIILESVIVTFTIILVINLISVDHLCLNILIIALKRLMYIHSQKRWLHMVTYYWYQLTKAWSTSQAKSIIKLVRSDSWHTQGSNSTEVRWYICIYIYIYIISYRYHIDIWWRCII